MKLNTYRLVNHKSNFVCAESFPGLYEFFHVVGESQDSYLVDKTLNKETFVFVQSYVDSILKRPCVKFIQFRHEHFNGAIEWLNDFPKIM